MRVELINPSDASFGTAVITPRWLYFWRLRATLASFNLPSRPSTYRRSARPYTRALTGCDYRDLHQKGPQPKCNPPVLRSRANQDVD